MDFFRRLAVRLVLSAVALLVVQSAAVAREKDEVLKLLIERSELVAFGQISNRGTPVQFETGVSEYPFDFKIQQVFKGDTSLAGEKIRVVFVRMETDVRDGTALLWTDSQCILFLKKTPSQNHWSGTDHWFSIQPLGSALVRTLEEILGKPGK